jgi:hypothetical protein
MKAIVAGMIATYPVGGVAWDYGQYALGLERLGFEVYYLEDTGLDSYHPETRAYGSAYDYGIGFLQQSLATLSPTLAKRWHVRTPDGATHGLALEDLRDVIAESAVFLNVSGSALMRDEYLHSRNKVLIDTDPGLTQLRNFPRWDARPNWLGTHGYRAHDHFFTYAELIGTAHCELPMLGLAWQPTRPPVVLDLWQPKPPEQTWTTVLSWRALPEPIEFGGRRYGGKELEFERVEILPQRTAAALEMAVGGRAPPIERWRSLGWSVIDPASVSASMDDYRAYIERSRGEFSVAKNIYVATGCGWFSCRSACYLAAGRPTVIQDTGYSRLFPCGAGVIAFRDLEGAAAALERIEADYAGHRRAAREFAEAHLASEVVLGSLLGRVGVG